MRCGGQGKCSDELARLFQSLKEDKRLRLMVDTSSTAPPNQENSFWPLLFAVLFCGLALERVARRLGRLRTTFHLAHGGDRGLRSGGEALRRISISNAPKRSSRSRPDQAEECREWTSLCACSSAGKNPVAEASGSLCGYLPHPAHPAATAALMTQFAGFGLEESPPAE